MTLTYLDVKYTYREKCHIRLYTSVSIVIAGFLMTDFNDIS